MDFSELPPEMVEEVLEKMGPRDQTRFLATSKQIRGEHLTKERARRIKEQDLYEKGVSLRAELAKVARYLAEVNYALNYEVLLATPELTHRLGLAFPRVGGQALVNYVILINWVSMYNYLNDLDVDGVAITMDETLSKLVNSFYPVGEEVEYEDYDDALVQHQTTKYKGTVTDNQEFQLRYIHNYLTQAVSYLGAHPEAKQLLGASSN